MRSIKDASHSRLTGPFLQKSNSDVGGAVAFQTKVRGKSSAPESSKRYQIRRQERKREKGRERVGETVSEKEDKPLRSGRDFFSRGVCKDFVLCRK